MVGSTEVLISYQGCQVRFEHYANPDRPVLLLAHGGGAHRGWWHPVVPYLVGGYELVVPDLSGSGDSEHRDHYAPELWAGELAAIVAHVGRGPVSFVGHSMGGLVGVFFAARHRDLLERLVLVDASLRLPEGDGMQPRGRERRPTPVYATLESAISGFHLRPEGTSASPHLLRRVARQGLRQVNGGWTWKFDPVASRRFTDRVLHEELPAVTCPTGLIYGEYSEVCGPHTVAYLERQLGRKIPAVEVPGAYHHVPLDAPEECAAAVEEVLGSLHAQAEPMA